MPCRRAAGRATALPARDPSPGQPGARFDSLALRPPAAAAGEAARLRAQARAVQALDTWCLQGAVHRVRQRMLVGACALTIIGAAIAPAAAVPEAAFCRNGRRGALLFLGSVMRVS